MYKKMYQFNLEGQEVMLSEFQATKMLMIFGYTKKEAYKLLDEKGCILVWDEDNIENY